MITEFSLDKEFFSSNLLRDESLSVVHDFITKNWINHGVLVLPKDGGKDFLELIKGLPPKYHQRWLMALEYGKKVELDHQWWNFCEYDGFQEACKLSGLFKTAFADDATSYVLSGGVQYKSHCKDTDFEILGAGVCSESINFDRSVELSKEDIYGYKSAHDVWNSRFRSLARFSKRIVIIDRYFFKSIWESAERNLAEDSMKNFFGFLAGLGGRFHIKIISHGGEKDSDFHTGVYTRFYNAVVRVPALSRSLESWELSSVEEKFFKDESHDRLIGFDKHLCQIGNGMRVFGISPSPRATFSAKYDHKGELSQREKVAQRSVLWKECS